MDDRFLKEEGPDVFTGNELLLKGALESGCSFLTGYPGSPISEFFDAVSANADLLQQRGIHADLAHNEALAVARLNGARMVGARAMAVMKSVGLHVAADGLALGNLSEPNNAGGCLVVVGDDSGMESTQINNDSRYLSQHLHMPVVEPATFQEIKDWIEASFVLSSVSNLYVSYRITTPQADGGGTVWARPHKRPLVQTLYPLTLDPARIDLDRNVLLPPRTWDREASLPRRMDIFLNEARHLRLNRILPGTERSFGFIAAGFAYTCLEHAWRDMGLTGRYPILKLGVTYPLDREAVLDLARQVDALVVIEEKRGFLESQVKEVVRDTPVWGKQFPNQCPGIPVERGLNVSILVQRLSELLKSPPVAPAASIAFHALPILPTRTPTFCPGCPHRDSSSVFLQIRDDFRDATYMQRAHGHKPIDLVFHGETGCFTMLMFAPNESLMHNYSGMGLGGGTGAGADPFITNKQVVFLGDSTFFHSGMLAVSDSLKNGQDVTYVILDNKTTAMTGHQPTPGTDINLMGEKTYAQSIEAIVRAMAGKNVSVTRMDPGQRQAYRAHLETTVLQDGVKIVIADKACGLLVERERRHEKKAELRREGFLAEERFIQINADACESCLECTRLTGCPGLTLTETVYGPKMATDPSLCVSDGACLKIQACPAFEEVVVKRKVPGPISKVQETSPAQSQPPSLPLDRPFYIHIAGVGGQGAGLLSAILVRAAQDAGWRVLFTDKKGLAIRNGSVFSQILLTKDGGTLSPVIPEGHADLVLGLDALEAARSVDPRAGIRIAAAHRTAIVANQWTQPTVSMLLGQDKPVDLSDFLRGFSRPDGFWMEDVASMAEKRFGSKVYANLIVLGVAAQKGFLPLTIEHLERAIDAVVPLADRPLNHEAFRAGRLCVTAPAPIAAQTTPTWADVVAEKTERLLQTQGARTARAYRRLVQDTAFTLDLQDSLTCDLARRLYDLIGYGGLGAARAYAEVVSTVARKDHRAWQYEATRIVIEQAFRVMAIKDEMYVSHLLTRPEKGEADRARYSIEASRGDRLSVRHFNELEIPFGRRTGRLPLVTRDWQLRLVSRMTFLRRWWPGWHRDEQEFRDWYMDVARRFEATDRARYDLWLKILRSPEPVRGYRKLRRSLMQHARQSAQRQLKDLAFYERQPA